MIRVAMKVQYDDGSGVDVVASAPDLIAFERAYDKPLTAFGRDVRIEWMMFLAWTALKRQRKTDLDFDAWIETIAEIAFDDETETDIVPLEKIQPTG